MRKRWISLFFQFALFFFSAASIARSEDIEAIVERRDSHIAFLGEIIAEVERYTDMALERRRAAGKIVFDTFVEESVKGALEDILQRRKAGQLILHPEMLRTLRPHPLLLVVYEGFSLGWTIGEIELAYKEAAIFDAQVQADLKRIERINRQITELDLEIAELYKGQALAQQTLTNQIATGQSGESSDYGPDFYSAPITLGANAIYNTAMACSYAAKVDPNLFGCSSWTQVGGVLTNSGEPFCACNGVPLSVPQSMASSPQDKLDELKGSPLGMTDELAEEIVLFCEENSSALTCLPPSEALRLGAYCEGPNALPDCGSPLKVGRIGGYCEGPNPLPDCLPTTSGD